MRKAVKIISALVFIVCVALLAYYYLGNASDKDTFEDLKGLVDTPVSSHAPTVLEEYAALYNENDDFMAWLKIDGTEIDYPVMYAPQEVEKYLHADFYGSYSYSGCLYIDEYCSVFDSDNITVYGHNMKNGSMFGSLTDFESEDFGKAHSTIQFDMVFEKRSYELVAAILTEIPDEDDEDAFRYYMYYGKDDKEMFSAYSEFIEQNRLYDTGVTLQEGDDILTLSTCSYHSDNGRFIVVARRIA